MLHHKELLHLSVFTKSGEPIGKIVGFVFDEESQSIVQYEVRRHVIGKVLLVHRMQVLSITSEKMIVEDAALQTSEEAAVWA